MTPTTFADAVTFVSGHGYVLVFLAMLIEGPIVTAAAAFASALGYFHLGFIITLSILADLTADILYYSIGYGGRMAIVEKYGHYVGITEQRIQTIEQLLHKHVWKTLIAIKIIPGLATAGLIIAGGTKIKLRKFATISLAITVPKSLVFVALGFYSGQAHLLAYQYFHYGQYGLFVAFLIILFMNAFYQKVSAFIGKKIEKV